MLGYIELKKHFISDEIVNSLNKKYIALDVETTGLNPENCLITEIGLAEFTNGIKTREYSSLIYINELLNPSIIELTGITNEMLKDAPKGEIVFKEVAEFIKEALNEEIYIVAHNADFDMSFIQRALVQYGIVGVINYVDTLYISRKLVKCLTNYKQDTVANHFNIINNQAHRALSDAITCGYILKELLVVYKNGIDNVEITTKYDKLFSDVIRDRGILYYRNKAIKNYYIDNNEITAAIGGEKIYSVKLLINDDSINGTCNCPFDGNCKHMYAVLLKYLEKNKK